jgi:hypothetical protein
VRVEVGKRMRVGPGDIVVVRGQLAANSRLSRLFVFAREGDAEFSPYVQNLGELMAVQHDRPQLYTPMSMRLSDKRPMHELSFIADIDGWIQIMQEVDRPNDTRAVVRISRTINPYLSWRERQMRRLKGIQLPWPMNHWFSRMVAQ